MTKTATVTLSEPIRRGDAAIAEVILRAPLGGDLRGLSIQTLMQADYNAVRTLIPRIASPQLLDTDFDAMPAADVAAFAGEVVGFFMTPVQRATVMQSLGLVDPEPSTA